MPGSSPEGKLEASSWLAGRDIQSVLDVGPGMGSWWRLLQPRFPSARWEAVEIFEPYLERYGLHSKYQRIYVADAATVDTTKMPTYDLAIFGDVIEHMPKPRAIEMVNRLPWRAAVISVPIIEYPQGPEEGNPWEEHIATWTFEDVLEAFPQIARQWRGQILGVFLLERAEVALKSRT